MGLAVRRFLGYVFPHLQGSLALLPGFHCRCETVVIRPRRTMAVFPARSGSTDGASFRAFVKILPCPVCAFLPLFTGVRGIVILRSSDAGSCIDRPPRGLRMASKALQAAWRSLHLVVLDGYAGRRMLGHCRSRLGHFPKTYAQGARSSERNPAPPRPDPLRVWARIAPCFGDYGAYKHLFVIRGDPGSRISIHRCYKL